ncbi:Crp/Fnr family transcriptional regulator [Limibaculum sp. M0105]|uniref:Crp/Fnr family transcriptional regulator n=1 Tax=Thermohalobaculum xanthum TaxID=2753746 RepID=A0A8J7M757_9RHOB|nr:Crp/Fnr family transcriptional regulator [Thermohalobaculum xanthum]MBK0399445.1 Crp/Fnr family transcriptional regulator [Thermohalobaculum xanthum]
MLSREDHETARRAILLDSMPTDVAETLMKQSAVIERDRGSSIFLQGEPAHSVYIVLAGWVKLYRIASNGAEAVVGIFTKGRSFGEAAAFRGDVYPVAAEAVTDCRLLGVRASTLLTMMEKRPELCSAMLAATYKHLHALVAQVEQLKAQTGAQRVAEFLLELCPVEEGACAVTLPYEKVLIAGRLGMKPESLSRAFGRLKEVGVAISQNHAAISDVAKLRAYVEHDRAEGWGQAL